MRELVTTFLDFLGLLAVSAGVSGGLWEFWGPWALCVGGFVLLVGSQVAERVARGEAT